MSKRKWLVGVTAATATVVAIAVASAMGASSGSAIDPAPKFGAELAVPPADDWPTVGGNIWSQRYSTLNQITTSNVRTLKLAWTRSIDGATAAEVEGSPIVYHGTMYLPTGEGHVAALDADTGERLWTYAPRFKPTNQFGIMAQRGITIGEGKVFVAQPDAKVVALDQQTGRKVWTSRPVGTLKQFLSPGVPLYYDGLVYIGHSGADAGARGHLWALNAANGRRVWRFWTVPGPGQPGHRTWFRDEWKTGGAAPWTYGAIDPELGLLYITTGNAWPYSKRGPGQNLYSASVIALDLKTGKYRWHFQGIHHDMWDYDCPTPPSLFNITLGGQERRGLEFVCKSGYVYELDRTNGRPLTPIVERRVPRNAAGDTFQNAWPTQPIPVGDRIVPHCAKKAQFKFEPPDGKPFKFACTFASYGTDRYVAMAPAFNGGPDWPPMSQDPALGRIFVCAQVSAFALKGRKNSSRTDFAGSFAPPTKGKQLAGTFTALNLRNNRIAWQKKWTASKNGACYSGSASTAGGVTFVGDLRGRFYAFNSQSGAQLWSRKLAMPISSPPISYAVDGRQYIAVYAGGPAALLGGNKKKRDLLYVFTLR
jgi:quinohemoprotein ethanol dehydrogenase